MKATATTLTLLVALAGPAAAQDPVRVGVRVGDPPSGDVVAGYDSGGRRDPFVSLVVPRRPATTAAAAEAGPRRTGLAALAVADAHVRGIVKHGGEMLAIVEGTDNQSFVVHVKDRLLDADVKSIDARGVVFVERVEGATGAPPREIRKPLRGAAEGIR